MRTAASASFSKRVAAATFGIGLLLSGCITGRPYTFDPVDILITALDATTKEPIANAKIKVVAVGNQTGRNFIWGGFTTDAAGRCHITTDLRSTWIGAGEAFAGAFRRSIEIEAMDYESRSIPEVTVDRGGEIDNFKARRPCVIELWRIEHGLFGKTAEYGWCSRSEVEAIRRALAAIHFPAPVGTARGLLHNVGGPLPIQVVESKPDPERKGRSGGDIVEYWLNRDYVVRVATASYGDNAKELEQWAVVLSRVERDTYSRSIY